MLRSLAARFRAAPNPREAARPAYDAIVQEARAPHWYQGGGVPDTIDGRFEMIAALLTLTLIRLEREPEAAQGSAWLAELFVADMDGQLREIGIGDVLVGKHIGRMMAALGGRIGAYRRAFADGGDTHAALMRNLYRGSQPDGGALDAVAEALGEWNGALGATTSEAILAGRLPASELR